MLSFEELWNVDKMEPRDLSAPSRRRGMVYNGHGLSLFDREGTDKKLIGLSGLLRVFFKNPPLNRIIEDCALTPEKIPNNRGKNLHAFAVDAHGAIKILSYLANYEGVKEFTEFFRENIFPQLAQ